MNAFKFKRHLNYILETLIDRGFDSSFIDIISINTKFDNSSKLVIYEILFNVGGNARDDRHLQRFIIHEGDPKVYNSKTIY